MVSLKQRQSGFTIVELLIVIVIIGILATLVIVTFSGVQQRARDSERKTDINAIAGQLEAAYAKNGVYPTLTELNNDAAGGWQELNEFRIDDKAFADPRSATPAGADLVGTAAANVYSYVPGPSGCAAGACDSYTLTATLESPVGTTYTRSSN